MKKLACVLGVVVLVGLAITCNADYYDSVVSAINKSKIRNVIRSSIDVSVAVTVGNHTYIPLNIKGVNAVPAKHVQDILSVLAAFEKAHPELKVTNWHIEKQRYVVAYMKIRQTIDGLWVDHEPRTK